MKQPRVHRMVKGGKLYKWHRVTRAPLPVDVPEDHPKFVAAWNAEEAKKIPPVKQRAKAGTIAAAVDGLKTWPRYMGLSDDYRRVVLSNLAQIVADYGRAPTKDLRQRHIEADLSSLPPHPANARLKAWRLLGKYMRDKGLCQTDPALGIRKRQTPKAESHAPWDAAEIAAYRLRWPIGTPQRKAFELLYWTGARTRDAVRLSPSHIRSDGLLEYRQTKTGNHASVPWTCNLPVFASGWGKDRELLFACLDRGFTYLEVNGRARSHKGLSNLISDAAQKSGFHKTAHGLRATRLTLIAEAGGGAQEVMAWGGHVTMSEADGYVRRANRRALLIGKDDVGKDAGRG